MKLSMHSTMSARKSATAFHIISCIILHRLPFCQHGLQHAHYLSWIYLFLIPSTIIQFLRILQTNINTWLTISSCSRPHTSSKTSPTESNCCRRAWIICDKPALFEQSILFVHWKNTCRSFSIPAHHITRNCSNMEHDAPVISLFSKHLFYKSATSNYEL